MKEKHENLFNSPTMSISEKELARRREIKKREDLSELRRDKIRTLQNEIKKRYEEDRQGGLFEGTEILGVDPDKLTFEDLELADQLKDLETGKIGLPDYEKKIRSHPHAGEDACQLVAWLGNKISRELTRRKHKVLREEISERGVVTNVGDLNDIDVSMYCIMKSAQAGKISLEVFWRHLQDLKNSIGFSEDTRQQFFDWLGLRWLELSEKQKREKGSDRKAA